MGLQEVEDQILKGRVDLGFGQLPEFLPQGLAVIRGGLMEQVRVVLFQVLAQGPERLHGVDITDGKLEFAFIRTHLPLDPHMIPRRKRSRTPGQDIAPNPAYHSAAFIPQDQGEVGFAGLVGAAFGLAHQEILLHHGAVLELRNRLMGHDLGLCWESS